MRLTDDQIGAELRALRPTPSDQFAAELDKRAAAGFPVSSSSRGSTPALRNLGTPRRLRLRLWLPAAAAVGVAAIVIAIAIIDLDDYNQGTNNSTGDNGASRTAAPPAEALSGGAGTAVAPDQAVPPVAPVPPNTTQPRNGRPQVQELSAALGLATGSDELGDAADGVVEVTNRYDGFVDSSDVHIGGSRPHASFTLRIPAADLRPALDDLSELGKVVSRDEGSTNVTGAYVDAGKGYRDARAKVDSLLEQLRNASGPSEAAAIRDQLVAARQQLAASRQALRGVKQRVTYAPVSVQIRAAEDGSWSIGDAADDSVDVLEAVGGALLIALAVLVPVGALLVLGLLGTRELQRRRREATLDRDRPSGSSRPRG